MRKNRSVQFPIHKVDDSDVERAYTDYLQLRHAARLLELKRGIALAGLGSAVGQPDFDGQLEKLLAESAEQFTITRADLLRARFELESLLCSKIESKPCKPKAPTDVKVLHSHAGPFVPISHLGGVPQCATVDSRFTRFLGVRTFDYGGLFDTIEVLPDPNTASRVRVKVDGDAEVSWVSAAWGLEVTDDFLTDHCKLEIGGSLDASGLVYIEGGGKVTIDLNTVLVVHRLPAVTLEELTPGRHSYEPDYWFTSSQFASAYVDTTEGLHLIPSLSDYLDGSMLDNGMFATGSGADFSLFEPDYRLESGDKIIVQTLARFEIESSLVALHLNDIGTLWMAPYIYQYKWH